MQIDHAVNLISRTSSVQLTVVPVVIVVRSGCHRIDRNHPSDCEQEARLYLGGPVVLCRFETTTAIGPSSYAEALGGTSILQLLWLIVLACYLLDRISCWF